MIQINQTNQIRWVHDGDKKTQTQRKTERDNCFVQKNRRFQKAMGNGTHNKSKKPNGMPLAETIIY